MIPLNNTITIMNMDTPQKTMQTNYRINKLEPQEDVLKWSVVPIIGLLVRIEFKEQLLETIIPITINGILRGSQGLAT